jgi:regulator of sigma E protease
LLLAFALLVWLQVKMGWSGMWGIALTFLGLSFIIFIHELGHFAVAKWCDVHVLTFSIGFGPALPGCSFRRGETTYKIALIPLGGYVKMVGEGEESEKGDDDPRSFKNKTVGQRMAIISAGVIMNLLFACACVVFVYLTHGIDRTMPVIDRIESGSPAWMQSIPTGAEITRVGEKENPSWEEFRIAVMLSQQGQKLPLAYKSLDGSVHEIEIEPRCDDNDLNPVIGVIPSWKLKLLTNDFQKQREFPYHYFSAAAAAREVDLRPGDVILATSDPDHPETLKPLALEGADQGFNYDELGRRLLRLAGTPMVIQVRGADGKTEEKTLPPAGFAFGDSFVGSTVPQEGAYDPFFVKDLPPDPRNPAPDHHDYFEFQRRMRRLAGKPVVVQVRRDKADPLSPPVNILVPPAYAYTFGMRMKMGEVAAVRPHSPAEKAGVVAGDILKQVKMTDAAGKVLFHEDNPDPLKVVSQLRLAAANPGVKMVTFTVLRRNAVTHQAREALELPAAEWDEQWESNNEFPLGQADPLSIPELGIAYRVESTIVAVDPDSPAARAGLQVNDVIEEARIKDTGKTVDEGKWGRWEELKAKRGPNDYAFDEWAHLFYSLQMMDYKELQVKVRRDGNLLEPIEIQALPDYQWPLKDRGWIFMPDTQREKADGFWSALRMGTGYTVRRAMEIYLQIRSLITNRISFKQMSGPLTIATTAYDVVSRDIYWFILLLGFISVNLAVVNFLPIPLLDGGHMVFLIYEKLRGKPASEHVRLVATYLGLAFVLSLMGFVLFMDVKRLLF